jgi:hypothetical protein
MRNANCFFVFNSAFRDPQSAIGNTMLDDYSKHQQGIIKRYYDNFDKIQIQKLSEMVTELFLAEGKKREKLWKSAATIMEKLSVPRERVDHILAKNDPTLVAKLVKELLE